MTNKKTVNLTTSLGELTLKNPVMTASGTFGYGAEYSEFVNLNNLGAVIAKGISQKPMEGNPTPRICETPCGMLNSIGLQNIGVECFIEKKLPYLKQFETKIIVNILGNSVKEYLDLSEKLQDAGVDAIELNVSCPNVKRGGIIFGTDKKALEELIRQVRKRIHIPLITKLSPNVADIKEFAIIAESAGSDALALINTITAMAIDIKTRKPKLANIIGGLSGPAVKPVAVRMVWECRQATTIPIIGMGGIMAADDALEFILAGASAVAVGTANFVNPKATQDIIDGIKSFMVDHDIHNIQDLIGNVRC
ncbi:dihydroorotate dehydrogenase [bacterium]|nr:MAG: dihydroorotate dehydrogenase [bacterium]